MLRRRHPGIINLGKKRRHKIVMLTAYDAPTGQLLDETDVDLILVGDSVATVLLGYKSTREISLNEMIHHARAVRRGVYEKPLIGDLPFLGERVTLEHAFRETRRFVREAKLDGVKIEYSGISHTLTQKLVNAGISVMGHVGLTPQHADKLGGYKAQGRDAKRAREILDQANEFQSAGSFAIVLECVPHEVAGAITRDLNIPTIGIGSGPECNGQVLVFQDLAGLSVNFKAQFVKSYDNLYEREKRATLKFVRDVRKKRYPRLSQSFRMKDGEFDKFLILCGSSR